jgi:dTMP kinase
MSTVPERGRFITFEGIDGAGKTTCIEGAAAALRARGIPLLMTREPGGTPVGNAIRSLLLDPANAMLPGTETLLLFAARFEHVHSVIIPALERGHWVLCDRFIDATIAYQGGGRGMPIDRITQLAAWVHPALAPDLTVLLEIDVGTAVHRISGRGDADRFESEAATFHERVAAMYRAQAEREPRRIRAVRSDAAPEVVRARVVDVISSWLDT